MENPSTEPAGRPARHSAASAPVEPSRRDYAMRAAKDEMPLFTQATRGDRNDSSWITGLSQKLKDSADRNRLEEPPVRPNRHGRGSDAAS